MMFFPSGHVPRTEGSALQAIELFSKMDAPSVLDNQLDALPRNVREPRRMPLGVYRGPRFGLVLQPHFLTDGLRSHGLKNGQSQSMTHANSRPDLLPRFHGLYVLRQQPREAVLDRLEAPVELVGPALGQLHILWIRF